MLKPFLIDALSSVPLHDVTDSLCFTASELASLYSNGTITNIEPTLKYVGFRSQSKLHVFDLPDLIWNSICYTHPRLSTYPLGQLTERAFKSTIARLLSSANVMSQLPLHIRATSDSIQEHFVSVIRTYSIESVLKLFLGCWFFELAISNIRSKRYGMEFDFGFSYHFSRDGHAVSYDSQVSLRDSIYTQCCQIASEFLPYILQSLKSRSASYAQKQIAGGLDKVVGVQPPQPSTRSRSTKPLLNVVVGSRSKKSLAKDFDLTSDHIRIILSGPYRNVSFNLFPLESLLSREVHTLVKDLLEIAFVVYMADLHVPRLPDLSRNLNILMPVRHLETWCNVQSNLEKAVSFLGRDRVRFYFVRRKEARTTRPVFNPSENQSMRCCLLSGGIDSAVGALWSLDQGLDPLFVSHSSSGPLSKAQKAITTTLAQTFDKDLTHCVFPRGKSTRRTGSYRLPGMPISPMPQHLRSFLYLSIATAAAVELGIDTVYMFENGPVALNPLISEAHINTRTAHPLFIQMFCNIVNTSFGIKLTIANPFVYRTKSSLCRYLKNKKLAAKILSSTISCLNYARVPANAKLWFNLTQFQGRHDGQCLPCILRRTATHLAKIPKYDDNYLVDIFNIFDSPILLRLPEQARDTIVEVADLLHFCRSIINSSDPEIIMRFPDFSVSAKGVSTDKLITLYRQYAKEIIECFRHKASATFRSYFNTILQP